MTDVHSHLLPGVDDGIQTFEEAEEAVRFLEQLGVRHMLLTPHVMEDYASNTADTLTERFAEFQRRIASSIHFTLAAEYMLDAAFQKHRSGQLLLLGKRRILVETSYMAGPPDLPDIELKIAIIINYVAKYFYKIFFTVFRNPLGIWIPDFSVQCPCLILQNQVVIRFSVSRFRGTNRVFSRPKASPAESPHRNLRHFR